MSKSEKVYWVNEVVTLAEAVKETGIPKQTLDSAATDGRILTTKTARGARLFVLASVLHFSGNRPGVGNPTFGTPAAPRRKAVKAPVAMTKKPLKKIVKKVAKQGR